MNCTVCELYINKAVTKKKYIRIMISGDFCLLVCTGCSPGPMLSYHSETSLHYLPKSFLLFSLSQDVLFFCTPALPLLTVPPLF